MDIQQSIFTIMIHFSKTLKALTAFVAGLLVLACTPTVVPELSLSDLAASFDASGSPEKIISVTSNVDWTVSCPDTWVTVSPAAGTGNGTFKISVAAHDKFEARSSTVTVKAGDKTATVKVSQAALAPALEVNPVAVIFNAESSSVELKVNSNAAWTVSANADWLTLEPASGQGDATVILTVAENNVRAERTAVVTVKETVGNTEKTVDVRQEALPLGHKADSLALVKIYTIADGANWKDSRRWTLTEPMDQWPGVKVNKEGRVYELSITNGTVSTVEWEIPEELADLTEVSTLQIVGSKLKGQIPEFLYGMTSLSKVRLNGNNLTGAISDKVSQLTELTELYVNENKELGGSLPTTMGQLKKLVGLNVAKTSITGAVPAELSGCESLQNFMAYEAKFTSIPDNWDQWPALKIVQLYGNEGLTCPLPASLGNAKKVTSLQLKNCNFTGNIPESYGNLPTTCNQLFLNGNQLKGVVPAAVQAHPKFQENSEWKYKLNILPQQEGYGLTLE